MPTRYIKESARTSKNLSAVSDFGERLFWRLITTADDFGRFMACPVIVKSACFPLLESLKSSRIQQALEEIRDHHLIGLYAVGDRNYGYFLNWEKHQGVARAKTSKYPDIPTLPATVGMCPQPWADVADAPKTDTDTKTDLNPPNSPSLKSTIRSQFVEFWALYPRKIGKGKAEKIWEKLIWSNGLFATICAQVMLASQTEQWTKDKGKYIPHPATWLSEKRWEDTYEPGDGLRTTHHTGFDSKDYRTGTW